MSQKSLLCYKNYIYIQTVLFVKIIYIYTANREKQVLKKLLCYGYT